MTFDRDLWTGKFSSSNVPTFSCPRCGKGNLISDSKLIHRLEPQFSKNAQSHPDWDPEWVEERFIMFLKCSAKECGEVVAASGVADVEEVYDDEFGSTYENLLRPNSMSPAPHIISMPIEMPDDARAELISAFQLYWSDFGASAMKIRTSLERLLDFFKVVRFRRAKDPANPTKPGKLRPFDLSTRIDKFISKNNAILHKEHLHALRVIGNLGTHQNDLSRTDILEAFQIYEHALEELVGKKSATIAKLAKKQLKKKTVKKKKK